jgi:N-acetyl-gamma-glutamylphosphate reductase
MKVILTGATGFIGLEVLTQLLLHPTISSVVVLSRRALPSSIPQSPKLKTIIMDDFTKYPPPIMAELSGADACIWYVLVDREASILITSKLMLTGPLVSRTSTWLFTNR